MEIFKFEKGVKTIAMVIVFLIAMVLVKMSFESVNADKIICIQNPFTGALSWYTTPGIKWQGLGKVTEFIKLETYKFKIPVRFNDGGHGTVTGSINYELPTDIDHLIPILTKYGSQESIQEDLIEVVTNKCVYMTGPLMSSKESYAEKRTSLIFFIEDQIKGGVYRTSQKEIKTRDPITGAEKTVTVAEIVVDKDNNYQRQEEAVLAVYGIKTSNFAVTELAYDETVDQQIKKQQEITMAVQTAAARAKEAEQNAITVAKEGEANAAKAKWEQEVLKAKAIVSAQQQLEVAKLERQAAEQEKQKQILLGEGEATRKRLVMGADGALEKKLEAYMKVSEMYATAMKDYKGNWVPTIVMGGDSKNMSGANDLINLLKVKTANDLAINMKMEGSQKTAE